MGEFWQAAVTSLRRLAEQVPDLARRTVALALTGQCGGTWLIDEDGDPVAPARLGCDRRAAPLVTTWCQEGVGEELRRRTGSPIDPSLQSVQLAWIARHEPELLAAAATALHGKDWLYFCCTGERATDPAEAVAAYGDIRRRTSVLDLLHLEEIAPLLPEIVDGTRHWGALSAAAAAATGLSPGTPVVLAPPDVIAIGLAAGIHQPGHKIGCTSLDRTCAHQQILRDPTKIADQPTPSVLPFADSWIGLIANAPGTAHGEWLIGMCEQFLADAGLIGMPRRDLLDLLERQAAEATPGQLRFQPMLATDGLAKLSGLSAQTTLYDMMRAIYESLGFAARTSFEALDGRPDEIRLTGAAAGSDLCRQV
ncbi:MAG: FGGY family carbohydrate kinase, partial [Nitrospirota bacterium]|nr:FGGY family carbohydrate kinase [Nitrospirota bacterium]